MPETMSDLDALIGAVRGNAVGASGVPMHPKPAPPAPDPVAAAIAQMEKVLVDAPDRFNGNAAR